VQSLILTEVSDCGLLIVVIMATNHQIASLMSIFESLSLLPKA